MRLLKLGGDVEVSVVPEHFGAGAKARRGMAGALYVDEVGGPRGVAPGCIVEDAVDADRRGGAVAGVVEGCLRESYGGEQRGDEATH